MKDTPWKRYLRIGQKALVLVKDQGFPQAEFDVAWLEDLVRWMEEKKHVTPAQQTAIENTILTVKNIIRFRKKKEKDRGQKSVTDVVGGHRSDVQGESGAEGPGER